MKKLRQITEEFDSIPEDKDKINSTHRKLVDHYRDIAPVGSLYPDHYPDHQKHIYNYMYSSSGINGYLWSKEKKNSPNEVLDEKVSKLKETIGKKRTPMNLTVYSGSVHDPREHMDSNGIMNHPAFLSTSIRKNVAGRFANYNSAYKVNKEKPHHIYQDHHLYQISVPKGHPAFYAGGLGNSYPPDEHNTEDVEKEMIFLPGSRMKHLKTEEVNHNVKPRPDSGTTIHRHFIHHMEMLPHKEEKE
jgi:hypothetical protein